MDLLRLCFVSPIDRARRIADNLKDLATTEPPKPPPGVEYPLGGSQILIIDGSVREAACEAFYEIDGDMVNLATMVLDAVAQV
ncbi:hypothetical protein QYM36_015629 [Artemia franciscana]|uniref:Uncharacterized protein n=1 Tax=Artemia franciscana TaxID=6661 RepID=A0AA88HFF8_ARTSF|nr:hypothetical protein QYM36_015629 [Artemia franciscana]